MTRRVPQPGHLWAPSASGRAQDGQAKIVWSISPIASDGASGAGCGAGHADGGVRR